MRQESRSFVPEVGGLDEAQWVIRTGSPGQAVRFKAPVEIAGAEGEVWVEVRALTHREALERESIGAYETYELADNGQVLSVVRRCDLWAMAEYDYMCSLVDFCLPERQSDGSVALSRMEDGTVERNLRLLAAMPPALAEWVQDCIDRVNLRTPSGQDGLHEAKKSSESEQPGCAVSSEACWDC